MRALTYVDDAIEALYSRPRRRTTAPTSEAEVISLRPWRLLVNQRAWGIPHPATPPERKRIDIGDYHADFSKIENALGWRPKVAVADALDRTLSFYRRNLDRYL